ncbi:MAG TPA: efflux RND transporter periplasmic adaptor subunit [Pirellulales bacterium]|nr:efflux RND transporter periplasmic adaptor subunit [Pirellulales bacterium]
MNRRRLLFVVVALGVCVALYIVLPKFRLIGGESKTAGKDAEQRRLRVEVIHPKPGGLPRSTTQPATVESFGIARLFAQVSGYLKTQSVDIGDHVEAGQVLAEIDVPQLVKQLQGDQADVALARSKVEQAKARVTTAMADLAASRATVQQNQADLAKANSMRDYRQKAYERIKALYELKSIEEKLVDEQQERLGAAHAAVRSAEAALSSARAQVDAAQARVQQAHADVGEATSNVEVAAAAMEKTQVLVAFAQLRAPFEGVVTQRRYYPGDFIRAGEQGDVKPLLAVARTDLMRVVVQVPDQDVPLVHPGKAAVLKIDTLPGREFHGTVSRVADFEAANTRTMRTEIDLKNPDNVLRDGMYGSATIDLGVPDPGAVTVPSDCLNGKVVQHNASVYLVRDGKLAPTQVQIGADDGIHVEVLQGLAANDLVVTHATGPLQAGTAVDVTKQR